MKSLIFALNAVLPIILMVLIGYFLKKIGFMKPEFSKAANKLVFRVFLPAMLFLNVYRIENIAEMNFGYALYAVVSLLILTAVMTPVVILFTAKKNQRGVLLQSIFRSNYALIGIPLASALFGEDGIIAATPTGSTAYSLSAGGPVVDPQMKCVILTPVCPHTLVTRSMVVDGNTPIKISVGGSNYGTVNMMCDGRVGFELNEGSNLSISLSNITAKFIKLNDVSVYKILSVKTDSY